MAEQMRKDGPREQLMDLDARRRRNFACAVLKLVEGMPAINDVVRMMEYEEWCADRREHPPVSAPTGLQGVRAKLAQAAAEMQRIMDEPPGEEPDEGFKASLLNSYARELANAILRIWSRALHQAGDKPVALSACGLPKGAITEHTVVALRGLYEDKELCHFPHLEVMRQLLEKGRNKRGWFRPDLPYGMEIRRTPHTHELMLTRRLARRSASAGPTA